MGKSFRRAIIAIGCLIANPAAAQGITAGRAIAVKHCARCHAMTPGHKSKNELAPAFSVIANRYSVWGLQEALMEAITVGHADMPQFDFSPEEINNLLAFMNTFARRKGKPQ